MRNISEQLIRKYVKKKKRDQNCYFLENPTLGNALCQQTQANVGGGEDELCAHPNI